MQGGNEGQKIYLSKIDSKILASAVDAYNGGIEVISTEDMNVTWEEHNVMNAGRTPGIWWGKV